MTRAIAYLFALCFLLLVGGAAFAQPPVERLKEARTEINDLVNGARRALYRIDGLIADYEEEPNPAPEPTPEPEPSEYPFYFPMDGLLDPVVTLHVLCDESMVAGEHVLAQGESFPWSNYTGGGAEIIYEARDDDGNACVYPFAPWSPVLGGGKFDWPDGSQFIWRSSEPGQRAIFRTDHAWAKLHFRSGNAARRYHVEIRDIELDFPGSIQSMGAVHIEAFPSWNSDGLVTAFLDNVTVFGGKNSLFVPSGRVMLYARDFHVLGNVGTNVNQEHGTYINGALSTEFVDSSWTGQRAAVHDGGHQLKNKALVQVYRDIEIDNRPNAGEVSEMPLMDLIGYGYVWAEGVSLTRVAPAVPREGLVHLRSKGGTSYLPSDVLPEAPVAVFKNLTVDSYRTEPHVIENHGGGALYVMDAEGDFESVARAKDEVRGDAPVDRDAFIRQALGLVE